MNMMLSWLQLFLIQITVCSNHYCHLFLFNKILPVERVSKRLPIGFPVDTNIFSTSTPTPPSHSEFSFRDEDLCSAPHPVETHLMAPSPTPPPDGDYYPLAPHSGSTFPCPTGSARIWWFHFYFTFY